MKLKKLEIVGFKSFADKTEIVFDEGITGIVGPNGSGKSNIGDAVRWVLGEQNARTLRGSRMEDVIFGGTALRKKANYCEVSLFFDNEDHALRSAYSEVMISRRVYRSGESEYYLNKTSCRLKDIQELFRDTGIGKEGYSLIGQGRIDDILSSKSDDRRLVFEEAAGVMTYRYRKEEAERKLDRTQDNLTRVNDIISELETRVEPLSRQAEEARVYLALAERLRELEIRIFVQRYDRSKNRLDTLRAAMDGLKEVLEQHEKDIQNNLSLKEQLSGELDAIEAELRQMREHSQALQKRLYEQKEEQQAVGIRIEGEDAGIAETQESIRSMKERLQTQKELLEESGKQSQEQEAFVSRSQERLEQEKTALNAALEKAQQCEEELNEHKTAILEAVNRIGDVKNQQARQQAVHAQMTARLEEILQTRDELKQAGESLKEKLKEAKAGEQSVRESLEQLMRDVHQKEDELGACLDETQHIQGEIHALQVNAESERGRLRLLQDLSREMEGYSQAVRKALQFAKGDPGIHDVLAKLIRVPREYETAIDMVLGGTLQNIVTEDENSAKKVIEYLRENRLGRATFLPMTTVRSRLLNAEEKKVLSMPGCIGVASDLIDYAPEYRGIVENLLGRTIIAKDLNSGIAIMRAGRHMFRLVTLLGDVMHSGGSMTGGTAAKTSSLLGRERQIEELKVKVKDFEIRKDELLTLQERAEAALREKRKDYDTATQCVQQEEIALAREQEHCQKAQEEADRNADEISRMEDAITQLRSGISMLEDDLKRVSEESQTVAFDREKMDEKTNLLQNALLEARNAAEALREKVQHLQDETGDLRHQLDMLSRDKQQKTESMAQLAEEIERTESNLSARMAFRSELKAKQERMQGIFEQAKEEADRAGESLAQREKEREARYERQQDAYRRGDELRAGYDADIQKYHRQELSFSKAENDLNNLCEHMFNTYELTYAAALELVNGEEGFELGKGEKEAAELRGQIREMGSVNVNAVEEYAAVKERYDVLSSQREDLVKAREDLTELINRLLRQMEGQFIREFDKLNGFFGITFQRLFGGGQAQLRLTDPDDALNCGIEVIAQPPGKKLQMLSLLSGGERALTAIAILFAMLKLKPTPFCILDEIEAALDEANIGYFADYLSEYKQDTQFVVVTHRKGTMERCDTLYGVAMQEQGISKMVSVDLREFE